jgi:cellulose synthase/poly-beta-1,6-N-acetylglucosamine synthase-like glycosyltransferase
MSLAEVVLVLYLGVLGVLSLNGMHRAWMVAVWLARRNDVRVAPPLGRIPRVTVQLPLYNERYVVERLVLACARLRWRADRLQIQILDDSTDDTATIAAALAERLRADGVDIVHVRRPTRVGFKAGALEHGLRTATGELVAIFDADFVPPPDFLERCVPWFADSKVGMVQARWGHLNAEDSWITRAQATLLDGHFVIEHTARALSGKWFNFNGTAGIWRRDAITRSGGWEHDTLTEDLDLSYRAQLAGWKFVYLPDVVAPAELPPSLAAFKTQQHRWAKGSIQTARKLLGRIWRAPIPVSIKLEATAHLCANFSYPLVVLLTLLLPLAVAARLEQGASLGVLLRVDLLLFVFAVFPFVLFYAAGIVGSGSGRVARRIVRLPIVLAVGLGMAVAQTRAVSEALFGDVGVFVRTPKHGGLRRVGYASHSRGIASAELVLATYLALACAYVITEGYVASLPFLALFCAGYSSIGLGSLRAET